MRRILTARQQAELLSPWLEPRVAASPGIRLPKIRGDWLDDAKLTQELFRRNKYSWIDSLTPEEIAEGSLWYPVSHEWGQHIAQRHGVFPYKVYTTLAATSPKRRWISQNLGRSSNIGDTHLLVSSPPGSITELGGQSGKSNLAKANAILAAPDDRESVAAAFLGYTPKGIARRPQDVPKTWDFATLLDNPEHGGAGNYMAQPGVVDTWDARSSLWSRGQWERAKLRVSRSNGQMRDYLKYPGKGTGKGLDAPKPETAYDPKTKQWYKTGEMLPPSLSEVAGRVIGYGGGYNRMRNALRAAAARRGLAYTHEGQAAIWAAISGNKNPTAPARHDLDINSIDHPEELWNEIWARRASGLITPHNPGGLVLPDHYHHDEDDLT